MQSFLFLNRKSRSMFHQRKRPAKIAWTVTYRKAHRKVRIFEGAWEARQESGLGARS